MPQCKALVVNVKKTKNRSLDSCRFVRMLATSDPQAAVENAAGSVSDHVDRQRREANARSLALSSDSSHYFFSVNCGDFLLLSRFSEFLWQGRVAFCPPYKVIHVRMIDYSELPEGVNVGEITSFSTAGST